MILSRGLVLVLFVWLAASLAAQQAMPDPAAPFAGDERAAKLAERYRAMLAANPSEGLALDRLWKAYEDHDATASLIETARQQAEREGTAPAWLICGFLLKKAAQFDAADAAYAKASKADPAGFQPPLARGDLAAVRRQPEAAAEFYTAALTKLPSGDHRRADVLPKLGNVWLAAGMPDKAAESWEQILALNPANLALHKQLAETYAKNHLVDQALLHYEYLEQHAEPAARAAALRELGRLHESRGDFDAAREALERGLSLTARDNWLNRELQDAVIRLYQRAGRAQELETRWRKAVSLAPRDLSGYLRLEALAEAQGDTAARLNWLEKIAELAPRDRDARLRLGRLLAENGQGGKAAAVYDELLKDQPENLDLIFARADLDLQAGATEPAVRRLEALLSKNPADETVAAPVLEFFLSHHLDAPAERSLLAAVQRQPEAFEPSAALAKFYFARRRADEARRVLSTLAGHPGSVNSRAERWQRLAETYKDENLMDDALRCWKEAAALQPGNPAPLTAAADVLLARGDAKSAADALQKAIDATPEGSGREETERKLFQILAAGFEPGASPHPPPRHRHRDFALSLGAGASAGSRPASDLVVPDGPLEHSLDALEETATRVPTPASYLRLARWQMWAREYPEAAASAQKAIRLDETNVPARQMLATLATDAHQPEVAQRRLREIIALAPDLRASCLRQIAALQMEDGNYDAALAVYHELQAAQPGALDALTDLALAQQRADRWFDALGTWKQAAALPSLTPAQRLDVFHPLVAAYEHLGEFQPAAEVLKAAVDDQPDLARKNDLFRELSDFCGKHALTGWLAANYENLLRAQPDDYFTMVAVAQLRKAQGHDHEAFELLSRAYFSAPDPAAALKSLADEAETLGEDDEAVADRRRLIGMTGQNTAENLEKLAVLEETVLDDGAASETWEQIAARFPRDPAALGHAAEYFERNGQNDRARDLTTQIVAIDPGDLPRLLHLGLLEDGLGHVDAARTRFEQVLTQSEPEKPGETLRLPPELELTADPAVFLGGSPGYFRSRVFAAPTPAPAAAGSDDRSTRLLAIRELAHQLSAPDGSPPARQQWLDRWTTAAAAGARSEPLEAFYSTGDSVHAMDLLAAMMTQHPDDERLRAVFLVAGLRLGAYARLARWAWQENDTTRRAPELVEALEQFLAAGGKPGDDLAITLFPPDVRTRDLLWRAAKEGFADRHWYAQAAELGQKVYAQVSSGRAAYAVELAQWQLVLGHVDEAREVLRQSVDEGGGTSFDSATGNPVFEVLRAYYLLLPAAEQAPFVENYLRRWRDRRDSVYALLSGVLLHGLAGDGPTAQRESAAVARLHLTTPEPGGDAPDARRWSSLLANGMQLQNWGLGPLAIALWRTALQENSPFDRADAQAQSVQAEVRGKLVELEISLASDPQAVREKLTEYLQRNPPAGAVNSLGTQRMAVSDYPAAQRIYEWMTRQEPDNGENWRNLLLASEAAGDTNVQETLLESLLDQSRQVPPSLNRLDLVCRLALLRENGGDAPGARRLLEQALHGGFAAPAVVTQLAQSYERAGLPDEAARVWKEGMAGDPGSARGFRLALATLEEGRGNLPKAIALLEEDAASKPPPGGLDLRGSLARLYLLAGRSADARNLGLVYLQNNDLESLAEVAQAFGQAGQQATAREWLAEAVRRSRDPQSRWQFQRLLMMQSLGGEDPPLPDFLRGLRRLRRLAEATPSLKAANDTALAELARRRGANDWLETELQREWRSGQGDFFAGEQLVGFYLDTRRDEPLKTVVQAIDHRPNLPEQSLYALEKRLVDTGHAALALPLSARLSRRFPENEVYALARARALWLSGQPPEASAVLEALDHNWVFRGDQSMQIAQLYQELGDAARAESAWSRAVQRDPTASRAIPAFLRLAQIETKRENWLEARRLLGLVYRRSSVADLTPLVDYLQASGRLNGDLTRRVPGDDFPLTVPRRGQLAAMIYLRLMAAHRLDAARDMVAAHPTLLAVSPLLAATFRQDTPPDKIPDTVATLEQALARSEKPAPRLRRELAALYVRWSDQELNGDAQRSSASRLEHLERAHNLVPGDFEVARRLAEVYQQSGRSETATATLLPFLEPDAVPGERAQAQQMIAGH